MAFDTFTKPLKKVEKHMNHFWKIATLKLGKTDIPWTSQNKD